MGLQKFIVLPKNILSCDIMNTKTCFDKTLDIEVGNAVLEGLVLKLEEICSSKPDAYFEELNMEDIQTRSFQHEIVKRNLLDACSHTQNTINKQNNNPDINL